MRPTNGKTTCSYTYILLTYNIIKYKGWILTFKILGVGTKVFKVTLHVPKLEGKFCNFQNFSSFITYELMVY